eukprot:gene14481-30829_t
MSLPRDGEVVVADKCDDHICSISFIVFGIIEEGIDPRCTFNTRSYYLTAKIDQLQISITLNRPGNEKIRFHDRISFKNINITANRVVFVEFNIKNVHSSTIVGSHKANIVIISKSEYFHQYPDNYPIISPDIKVLDFIEIGACYSYTAAHNANLMYQQLGVITNGISIEPLLHNLDSLPISPGLIKINAAIDNKEGVADMYSFPFYDISNETFLGVEGSSKLYIISPEISQHMAGFKYSYALVQKHIVRTLTIDFILNKYTKYFNEPIRLIKADVEGYDTIIINGILDYYISNNSNMNPCVLCFETDSNPENEFNALLERLKQTQYVVHQNDDGHYIAINYNCSYHSIKRAEQMLYPDTFIWGSASREIEEMTRYLKDYRTMFAIV